MENLMSPQIKSVLITDKEHLQLKEQVIFQNKQEGKRVWESGIVIARYLYHNKDAYAGKTVLELGSGTGIGGLSLIKFSRAKKVILTDYTEEILALLEENVRLQPSKAVQNEISLIDWTDSKCFERLRDISIDCVIATDVIYKGSPYKELAQLLHFVSTSISPGRDLDIKIIIPKQRDCCEDFLENMKKLRFTWTVQPLEGDQYTQKALENQKESDKYYPGLRELDFLLFSFKLQE